MIVGGLLLAVGCATSGEAAPSARAAGAPALDPSRIPEAPSGYSGELLAAWNALRSGAYDEAETRAVTLGGSGAPATQVLTGFLAITRGDDVSATRDLQAAVNLQPGADQGEAAAAYGLGLVAERGRDSSAARAWYQRALDLDPSLARAGAAFRRLEIGDMAAMLSRAESAAAGGRVAEAIESYEAASRLAPDVIGPYLKLADLHAAADDPQRSIEVLTRGARWVGDQPLLLERLGGLYELVGDSRRTLDTYQRLAELLPGDARVAGLARAARDSFETASLPPEYRRLAAKGVINRQELAAVLAINLADLESHVEMRRGVIVADGGNRWSTPFIRRTVEWGVLDVYQNNEFYPDMEVRRSMLVEACYRVLDLLGLADGAPRPSIQDPPPGHLLFRPAQAVVGHGLMELNRESSLDLLEPISGGEAIATVRRLAALLRARG